MTLEQCVRAALTELGMDSDFIDQSVLEGKIQMGMSGQRRLSARESGYLKALIISTILRARSDPTFAQEIADGIEARDQQRNRNN